MEDIFGQEGIRFNNIEEANVFFFQELGEKLNKLNEFIRDNKELNLDFSFPSFIRIETYYKESYKNAKNNKQKEEFLELINTYVKESLVKNKGAKYKVMKNEFSSDRYDLGIEFPDGSWIIQNYTVEIDEPNINNDSVYKFALERFEE